MHKTGQRNRGQRDQVDPQHLRDQVDLAPGTFDPSAPPKDGDLVLTFTDDKGDQQVVVMPDQATADAVNAAIANATRPPNNGVAVIGDSYILPGAPYGILRVYDITEVVYPPEIDTGLPTPEGEGDGTGDGTDDEAAARDQERF